MKWSKATFTVPIILFMAGILLTLFIPPCSADASGGTSMKNAGKELQEFDQAAALLYKHATDGNVGMIRDDMTEVSRLFSTSSVQGALSLEGIHVLSGSILELQEVTQSVQASPDAWLKAAANLRLAADALAHPRQPLWQQYYKILKEDVNAVQTQFAKGNQAGFAAKVAILEEHYTTIRTAAVVSKMSYQVVRADSWISYMKGLGNQEKPDPVAVRGALEQGTPTLNALFGREKDATALAPFIPEDSEHKAELAIGLVLITVLAYAGYRKYAAQQLPPPFR